ncbi:MAG: phage major capsid protein, partial [Alphaproteobacteria bacterium]
MTNSYQTKAAIAESGDVAEAFDDFMQAFEAYKHANNERLSQIEKNVSVDVLTTEKMQRIDQALDTQKQQVDTLLLKARRPRLHGENGIEYSAGELAHKSAFEDYVRRGETAGFATLEAKSLSVGADADGGYLVPDSTEREIGRLLSNASPMRAISNVREISGAIYKKPFATTGMATGWTAETGARTQTTTPTLAELSFPAMEL